ncbi:hypothetical protein [Sphaerisporangium perillae]|uniref:hypothetical protein n=1 Tax=Sphaerisporangium perillae TaxID=2935860 RepID=UPI00200FE509|nr:hypothetical protein [Sphaerisporangium perillae]
MLLGKAEAAAEAGADAAEADAEGAGAEQADATKASSPATAVKPPRRSGLRGVGFPLPEGRVTATAWPCPTVTLSYRFAALSGSIT